MISAKLAAAFGTWREAAADSLAAYMRLRRALMSLTRAKLAASFRTWRDVAADMKTQSQWLGGALQRMLQRLR